MSMAMAKLASGPPCTVCGKPSRARGYCDTHYSRWYNHGHVEDTRKEGWGSRSNHPLRHTWRMVRQRAPGCVERWNDLALFVVDVGERPSPRHWLMRSRPEEPFGPDNFKWVEAGQNPDKAEYMRRWNAKNADKNRAYRLKRQYGLEPETVARMREEQGGVCAICTGTSNDGRGLHVDHCHTTKKVRALLCSECNRAIGLLKDDADRALKLAMYLEKHK